MKQTKHRVEIFSFFNQRAISTHLEKMAQEGWMIERLTNMSWVYRRMEPRKIKFAVSYYPKASEFDPEPTQGQRVFQDFCAHTGWKLACTSAQLQIFYNEQADPIPIATEPVLELEAIHATAKRSFLVSHFLLLGLCILQAVMFLFSLLGDPIELLANPIRLCSGLCFVFLFALSTGEIGCYLLWYARAKKAAAYGEFLSPPDTSRFQKIILALTLVVGVYFLANTLFSGEPLRRWIVLLMCAVYPLLFFLVNGTKNVLKRRKASRGLNRTVTMAASFLVAFALMGGVTFGTLRLSQTGFFAKPEEQIYEYNGMTWVIHQDVIPLTVEDLVDIEFDGYIKEQRGEESLFLGYFQMHQWPRLDAQDRRDIPTLEYKIVVVKIPLLYDLCKNRLISEEESDELFDRAYAVEAAEPWGAREVYRLQDGEYGPRNQYLLCYDHMIVELQFDWEPSAGQMEIVGERLKNAFAP